LSERGWNIGDYEFSAADILNDLMHVMCLLQRASIFRRSAAFAPLPSPPRPGTPSSGRPQGLFQPGSLYKIAQSSGMMSPAEADEFRLRGFEEPVAGTCRLVGHSERFLRGFGDYRTSAVVVLAAQTTT
jgi:hypothetical protein